MNAIVKTNNPMNPDEFEIPSPDELAEEAENTPRKVNFRSYYRTVCILRGKGFSYGDIADWLGERIGQKPTRSQVAYLLTTPPDILAEDEEAEQMQAEAEEAEESNQ